MPNGQSKNGPSRETGNTGDTINVREYRMGNQKMDSSEKLATQGTQDEEKQNKNTTQYVLGTTMRKQAEITLIKMDLYKFSLCVASLDNINVCN